jgi:hypothetical protein
MLRLRCGTYMLALVTSIALACGGDDDGGDSGDNGDDTSGADAGDTNQPDASGSTSDAGPTEGIPCGDDTCDETAEECCVDGEGGQTCVDTDTCEGTTVGCDGPEDCTVDGEICCGEGDGAQCVAAVECNNEICQTNEDCPDEARPECCALGQSPIKECLAECPGN